MPAILGLALLLVLPAMAVATLARPFSWIAIGWITVLSLVAAVFNAIDKRRAQAGAWRIPESTLHLLELLGGWPGAFIAQRVYRHKTAKPAYQTAFWGIVILYQLVAVDCLRGWEFLKAVFHG